jgi:hypothetical protein
VNRPSYSLPSVASVFCAGGVRVQSAGAGEGLAFFEPAQPVQEGIGYQGVSCARPFISPALRHEAAR